MPRFSDLLPADPASEDETKALGRALARELDPGDVLALYGDLGAGKTVLTKGIGRALGVSEDRINSPTFTLLNEYASAGIPLYHFDAYRIESPEEFFDLGYEDYFFGEGICVVEWADKVEQLLPDSAIRLRLEHRKGQGRRISMMEE